MSDTSASKLAFRRLLVRSVVIPAVAMMLLALVLIVQVRQLVTTTKWVEHTDEVISRIYRAEATHVLAQSAVRGFLLTGDENDLSPAVEGRRTLPGQLETLRSMTNDRPEATKFCDMVVAKIADWQKSADERIDERRRSGVPSIAGSGQAKIVAADIAKLFDQWIDQESALRAERNAQTQRSAAWTIIFAGGATVLVGVFLSLLSRGQLRWLSQTYESALARATDLSQSLERRVAERTDALEKTNGRLNEVNQELEAFAYSVSHDLRAPMRHISGFANLLKLSASNKLSPDDVENVDTIHNTAVLAGRMVDDLLAFSRIGRSQLRVEPIEMNQVVQTAIRELAPELDGRKIEWAIADLPPLQGDPGLMRLVVQNLLANAIKYTNRREVAHIEVGGKSEEAGNTYWVKDNGVGFDMAYAHKLFGVFQRLHRAEEFEGTGIGLANVRRIILRHGGRTWAEGVPDAGATFFFFVPRATPR